MSFFNRIIGIIDIEEKLQWIFMWPETTRGSHTKTGKQNTAQITLLWQQKWLADQYLKKAKPKTKLKRGQVGADIQRLRIYSKNFIFVSSRAHQHDMRKQKLKTTAAK
jgi:hypothetical protein